MASHSRSAPREDADGVRVFAAPGGRVVAWLAAAAMLLIVAAIFVPWLVRRGDVPRVATSAPVATPGVVAPAPTGPAPPGVAPARPASASPKPFRVARRKTPPAAPPSGA